MKHVIQAFIIIFQKISVIIFFFSFANIKVTSFRSFFQLSAGEQTDWWKFTKSRSFSTAFKPSRASSAIMKNKWNWRQKYKFGEKKKKKDKENAPYFIKVTSKLNFLSPTVPQGLFF